MNEVTPLYRILIVCAGNTCRSPLAAVSLRRALGPEGRRVEVQSAGVMAQPGAPATPVAIEVAAETGLDLGSHRAQRLDADLIEAHDLLLVVDHGEYEAVRRLDPEAVAKTHLLADYGAERARGEGVPDPYGGSREAYEECLRRIDEHSRRIAPLVLEEMRSRLRAAAARGERRGG